MAPDEMNKTIEFILQSQAQFTTNIGKLESNLSRCEANIEKLGANMSRCEANIEKIETSLARCEGNIDKLRLSVGELAGVLRESIRLSDDRFTRLDERIIELTAARKATEGILKELAEGQKTTGGILKELAEGQRTTDERLNALINVVEKHITGPDHSARA